MPTKHKIPKQKHINAVGIEFEGGWASHKIESKPALTGAIGAKLVRPRAPKALKYDGSVTITNSEASYKGEIASPPLQIRNIKGWIDRNHPDIVNKTCGTHVHVSVKDKNLYTQLTTPDFHKFYLKNMGKWGRKNKINNGNEFWERFNGNNTYCKNEFNATQQIYDTNRSADRYTQINYCYGLWKTVEFRMLPAFEDPWFTTSAIFQTLIIVENWLETAPPLQDKWEDETEIAPIENDSEVYEETATYQQIQNYRDAMYGKLFDSNGWICRSGLKLTGKNTPLKEYIIKPSQAYLVPENITKATKVISTTRLAKEKNYGENFSEVYNQEGEE